jgi:hypothetical protein
MDFSPQDNSKGNIIGGTEQEMHALGSVAIMARYTYRKRHPCVIIA